MTQVLVGFCFVFGDGTGEAGSLPRQRFQPEAECEPPGSRGREKLDSRAHVPLDVTRPSLRISGPASGLGVTRKWGE